MTERHGLLEGVSLLCVDRYVFCIMYKIAGVTSPLSFCTQVGQWLVAVKRLIHESREMKKEKDRSCTEQTETDLDTSGATINMIKMLDVEAITTDAEQQEVDAESGADVVDAEGGDDVDVIDAESGADIDAGSSVDG